MSITYPIGNPGNINADTNTDTSNTNAGNDLEKRAEEPHVLRLDRNIFWFNVAKTMAWSLIKPTSYKHYEIPPETLELMKYQNDHKDVAIYYVGPHKSMWETLGIPYAISWHDGDVPFIMMGSNLVKRDEGRLERWLMYMLDRSGVVSVEREVNPRAAVPIMIDDITRILSANHDVLIFAEGTRSRTGLIRDFKPAGFQGLVQAVSGGTDAYIVNFNVDYSRLIELPEFACYNELMRLKSLMLSEKFSPLSAPEKVDVLRNDYYSTHFINEATYAKVEDILRSGNTDYKSQWSDFEKSYKFKVKDSKQWKVHISDVYISFDKPRYVRKSANCDYRRELAEASRKSCMDLVKIQKINVLSEAIVRMNPEFGAPIYNNGLYRSVIGVLKDYAQHEDKFRGFTSITTPAEIVKGANIEINSELLEAYKIYANNTAHLKK